MPLSLAPRDLGLEVRKCSRNECVCCLHPRNGCQRDNRLASLWAAHSRVRLGLWMGFQGRKSFWNDKLVSHYSQLPQEARSSGALEMCKEGFNCPVTARMRAPRNNFKKWGLVYSRYSWVPEFKAKHVLRGFSLKYSKLACVDPSSCIEV